MLPYGMFMAMPMWIPTATSMPIVVVNGGGSPHVFLKSIYPHTGRVVARFRIVDIWSAAKRERLHGRRVRGGSVPWAAGGKCRDHAKGMGTELQVARFSTTPVL